MTPYRRTELAISVGLVVIGVLTVVLAHFTIRELTVLQDRIGARSFAYAIGTIVAFGGLVLLAMQTRGLRLAGAAAGDGGSEELGGDDPSHPASARRAFTVMLVLVLYAVLMRPAGYILATIFFVSAGTAVMGGRGLTRLLWYPILYAIGTYLLFDTVLGVRIPDGVLRPLIRAIGLG